jgi:NAD(P)-dependent dehydrogenase (short-subunit alcohol dehydrogenase family)
MGWQIDSDDGHSATYPAEPSAGGGGVTRRRRGTAHRDGAILRVVDDLGRKPSAAQGPDAPAAADRVAVVTGGSRGLGLALVRALAQQSMRVVMATRSPDRGRSALDLLGDLADRISVRRVDITDPESVARLAAWLDRQLGRCDALINNAAVLIDDDRGALDVDLDVVRRTLETNLLGTWRVTQAVAPLMRRHRYGRIVNVSSELGSLNSIGPGLPAYRISHTAINALSRIMAGELAHDGILVNACCPGPSELSVADSGDAVEFRPSEATAVWLATLPDDGPTGGFFRDGRTIEWLHP